jgi:hypothetical protein
MGAEQLPSYLNISAFPIIYCHAPAVISAADIENGYAVLGAWLRERPGPYGFVLNFEGLSIMLHSDMRRAFAEGERRMADWERLYNKGQAVIISNPILRAAVTTVYWLAPPVYPLRICGTLEEGAAWVNQQLAKAGIVC